MKAYTHNSPHGVEIVIRWHIIFIVTSEAKLISIALMYKVPELFRTERLHTDMLYA